MTLEDVARSARVSTATVSRVVNNISPNSAKRSRVLRAIEQLKYSPNLSARSLAMGTSRSIGVVVSNIENPYFLDVYKAVEGGARRAGYEVIIANTGNSPERLAASVLQMRGHRVSGLAAIGSELDAQMIEELGANGIRVASFHDGAPRQNTFHIGVDYHRAMERMVAYLYGLGHRRLGVVSHRVGSGVVHERLGALLRAVCGFPDLQVEAAEDADSLEGGYTATRALLGGTPGITVLLCANDWTAMGALRALRDSGLRVPGDISVTGFDDVNVAQFCSPALTTVHIARDRIGRKICDFLLNTPAPEPEEASTIDAEVVVRESTGRAATRRQ
jgi:DNA-binding LacI/PurR family transcriptional regulator